jgi:DNA-binding transcriptional ArsR family regulator
MAVAAGPKDRQLVPEPAVESEFSIDIGQAEKYPRAGSQAPEPCDVSVFAALAHPIRRRMLEVLVKAGQASATQLAEHLPVSRQAVVKHLHVLHAAGLVCGVRTGREVLYMAKVGTLEASARWLNDLSATWYLRHGPATTEGPNVRNGHGRWA